MDSYLDSFDPFKSVSPAGIFTNRVEVSCYQQFLLTLLEFEYVKAGIFIFCDVSLLMI